MSFQAYLDTIQKQTGLNAEAIKAADAKGFSEQGRVKPGVKAGQVTDWLKAEQPRPRPRQGGLRPAVG